MDVETIGSPLLWGGFVAFIAVMLALDLVVFHRKARVISTKDAAIWSAVWVALSLAFNLFVLLHWGYAAAQAFFTGYLLEKALSVDNLFVFYMIFAAFAVPAANQHRLLFWGIIGALILRAAMVFAGSYMLVQFHWAVYFFGLLLLATGVRMLARPHRVPHPERGRVFRAIKRIVPTTDEDRGSRLFTRDEGVWKATPYFLILLMIEFTDVVFAVDSILAVFAITTDPFIVFTSNIFAVMGMRSLYFLLSGMAARFVYLQPGLALVLVFVGVKMAIMHWVKIPVAVSLGVVALLLGGSIVASLIKTRRRRGGPTFQEPLREAWR